jgi:8-oxo-dGTP pyrophosphatase MutT (NUDIX family)
VGNRFVLRTFLHLYWRLTRGLTLGVRAAVLDAEGRVLLVHHTYTPGWHLPGGGVEPGESAFEALERELSEEGNVRLAGAPRLHGLFQNRTASSRDHVAVFVIREFEWGGAKPRNMEIREAAFFPVDDLPDGTSAGTRRRIDEIVKGRPPGSTW